MSTDFKFTDLLKLDKFITPMIMTVVYWILLATAILTGIAVLVTANGLAGLMTIILAPIYVRVLCEMVVLFFKIHSVLCEIRDQRKPG